MLFQNPVFNKGLNVTVRNGSKWMKVEIGDTLLIKGVSEESSATEIDQIGTLAGKALLPMRFVPDVFLIYEHDPYCRTRDGLLAEMKKVYQDFSENNIVTVLLFYL